MQNAIKNLKTLNANDIDFKYKNVDGKPQVTIRHKTNGVLTLFTPWLISAFGISSYKKFKGATEGLDDWTLDLKAMCYENLDLTKLEKEYDYAENKEQIACLMKFFNDLHQKAIDFAHTNSSKLFKADFNKKLSSKDTSQQREMIEDNVTHIVKKSDNKDANGNLYPDKITTKIMKKDELPDIVIEDFNYVPTNFSSWEELEENMTILVQKGTPLCAGLQVRSYFVNGKLGFTLKLMGIQVDDKRNNNKQSVFTFREKPVGVNNAVSSTASVSSSDTDAENSDNVDNEEIEVEEHEEEIEVEEN